MNPGDRIDERKCKRAAASRVPAHFRTRKIWGGEGFLHTAIWVGGWKQKSFEDLTCRHLQVFPSKQKAVLEHGFVWRPCNVSLGHAASSIVKVGGRLHPCPVSVIAAVSACRVHARVQIFENCNHHCLFWLPLNSDSGQAAFRSVYMEMLMPSTALEHKFDALRWPPRLLLRRHLIHSNIIHTISGFLIRHR